MINLTDWNLSTTDAGGEIAITNGNRFLTGNGYLGYRGTLEEADLSEMPATIVSGLYDRYGDLWREPVNAPNSLSFTIFSQNKEGKTPLTVTNKNLVSHIQSLDFRYGIHRRKTSWDLSCEVGGPCIVKVDSERFVHMEEKNLLCLRYSITATSDVSLTLRQGIDCNIRDLNGPHLENFIQTRSESLCSVLCRTRELKHDLSVTSLREDTGSWVSDLDLDPDNNSVFYLLKINLTKNEVFTSIVYASICTSLEKTEPGKITVEQVYSAQRKGWTKLLEEHKKKWDSLWETGDVIIEGDTEAQQELRYSLYQLQILAPRHTDSASVPARALSGQTYKGAVFWDTEMFISPYFLATDPSVVRRFVMYRIKTLDGARRKASWYGYRGAFYAWESQETGDDVCSDFNVVDVFTGRPVKTWFKDKQVHITAAVAYGLVQYLQISGERAILADGGLEMLLECARFYISLAWYSPERKRYEILDVIGPDEYHERVHNNAFTNRMVLYTLEKALSYLIEIEMNENQTASDVCSKIGFSKEERERLEDLIKNIYIPQPRQDGVIEQFDDYFRHEDCSLREVKSRLKNPKEYWGGSGGVASATQIIKQADVALLLSLFDNEYPLSVLKSNFDYYEPRTEHGSSLSPCVYSLLACDIGDSERGYSFFRKTAGIDITGKSKQFAGLVYIGGTHPGASGGAWLSVVRGFCGFRIRNGEITIKPCLPETWTKVTFFVILRQEKFKITVTKETYSICKI